LSQEEPVVPTNTDHTSKQFDVELEALRARVLKMGGLVEEQIKLALEGLMTGDVDLCDKVEENDHKVNALEVGIDEDVSSIIARRQPAASDLRMLMTVVKTITDLERIGDEADKIARMAKLIYTDDRLQLPRTAEIRHMSQMALQMLRNSLFARLDLPASAEVVRQDRNVDEEFRSILRQLITFMMEDPRNISLCIEILFIAKAIERIGDHAKNISEYVVYMVKGKDVRHVSLEEIEREVLS
jgi:phosphate transport system protein